MCDCCVGFVGWKGEVGWVCGALWVVAFWEGDFGVVGFGDGGGDGLWCGAVRGMLGVDGGLGDEDGDARVLETPIFVSHSRDDDVVPWRHGVEMCRTLRQLGFEVE